MSQDVIRAQIKAGGFAEIYGPIDLRANAKTIVYRPGSPWLPYAWVNWAPLYRLVRT